MKINLRIEFVSGETRDVSCIAADMVAFEKHFEVSIASLEKDARLTYLLFLAHSAETRTKSTVKSFDEWIEDVAGITVGDADPK